MEIQSGKDTVKIGNTDYSVKDLSENIKLQIVNIQFCDEQILQHRNLLSISNTARNGYLKLLKGEYNQARKVRR